jgi:mRNA interferase RelE/StbE
MKRIRNKLERKFFIFSIQIKKLKGNWEGFLRMRVGKIRVIFTVNNNSNELLVYEIDFRGDAYKK